MGDAQTSASDSGITNSGIVRDLKTRGINSEIINSGVVRGRVDADGDSSIVINSGVIEEFSSVDGDNSSLTNSGTIERTFNMRGQNPTLTLLGGSVFKSDIILGGGGTTTINLGAGLNLDILLRAGRPDVLNTRGAFVQKGKRVLVLDPTGFAASDVIIGDLTSAIFNAVGGSDASGGVDSSARVSTQGTGPGTGRPVWARAFGGVGTAAGDGALTDIDSSVFGLIAGVNYGRFGVFGGGATSEADTEFNAQNVDVDSVFAGVT